MLIVDKQREKFVDDKALETAVHDLELNINILANAESMKVRNYKLEKNIIFRVI